MVKVSLQHSHWDSLKPIQSTLEQVLCLSEQKLYFVVVACGALSGKKVPVLSVLWIRWQVLANHQIYVLKFYSEEKIQAVNNRYKKIMVLNILLLVFCICIWLLESCFIIRMHSGLCSFCAPTLGLPSFFYSLAFSHLSQHCFDSRVSIIVTFHFCKNKCVSVT